MPPGAPTPRRDESSGRVWWATGLETPVFFDSRGHRAKLVRFGGAFLLALVATWLVLVVSGPVGFGRLPAEHFELPHVHHHHSVVIVHRRPAQETPES